MNAGIFLITFRESFEAFLLTAVLISFFIRSDSRKNLFFLLGGAGAGVLASIAFTAVAGTIYDSFDGIGQDIFQAGILLMAAISIATVLVFLGKAHTKGIEETASKLSSRFGLLGVALAGFVMVFREGLEMALFLAGFIFQSGVEPAFTLAYGFAGIATAFVLCGAVFWLGLKVPFKYFFGVTSFFLILLVAGMAAGGIGKLVEIDLIPAISYEAWNTNWLLNEGAFPGTFFSAMIGYNANPTMTEALVYLSTLAGLLSFYYRPKKTLVPNNKPVLTVCSVGAFALFTIFISADTASAKKVYSPNVVQGEKAVEYFLDFSVDSRPERSGKAKHQIEFEYAPFEFWSFGLYAISEKGGEESNPKYTKTKLEIIHQLAEQGEYFIDTGLYFEYQKATDEMAEDDAFEFKLLLEKEFDKVVVTLNPVVAKRLTPDLASVETYEYANAISYRYDKLFTPAIEFYGDLGRPGNFGLLPDEKHYAGPVVYGRYKNYSWRVGTLFGLTDASDDVLFTLVLEAEFF